MTEDGKRRWRSGSGLEHSDMVSANPERLRKRGVKSSSRRWLERQIADPYVRRARALGYPCRSAFKLLELQQRFGLIGEGMLVADLGCAPGGWTRVALQSGASRVVGIDLQPVEAVSGAQFVTGDICDVHQRALLVELLGEGPDIILSDMASSSAGHRSTDHLRTEVLAMAACDFAVEHLVAGGSFCCKVFGGGSSGEMLSILRRYFARVRHFKPPASRSGSAETFVIARGFRGR